MVGIFKEYDVRGVYPTEINEEIIKSIAAKYCTVEKAKEIIVGRDVRLSSPTLTEVFIETLLEKGKKVLDCGIVSKPVIMYASRQMEKPGVMITASHNPKEYNGIKLNDWKGMPRNYSNYFNLIEKAVEAPNAKVKEKSKTINPIMDYLEFVRRVIDFEKLKKKKVNFCFDFACGSNAIFAKKLTDEITDKYQNDFPDGTFASRSPDPTKKGALDNLIKQVKEENLDYGLALDPDGDRFIAVDANGSIWSEYTLYYFSTEYQQPKVVFDTTESHKMKELIEKNGGMTFTARVGSSNIEESMRINNANIGGESSGHFFFDFNKMDDGLLTGLYFLKVRKPKVPKLYISNIIRIPFEGTLDDLKKMDSTHQDALDGVKHFFKDGWVLFRKSNTEPKVVIRIEGYTQKTYDILVEKTIKKIESSYPQGVKPFMEQL